MPTVLSVQSRVAYGHVGNAASVFPLQRLGIEAWALDTVAFSNHTGHGRWRGAVVAAAAITEVFEGIAEFFRDTALALADIITPNRFELEYLTGHTVATLGEAGIAAAALRALGPGIVLVTSIEVEPDRIAMLAAGPDGVWAVETPRLPVMLNGCGDVTAALFLGRLLRGEGLPDALALTAASMYGIIEATMRLGRYELALVAAQEELVAPSLNVVAQKL